MHFEFGFFKKAPACSSRMLLAAAMVFTVLTVRAPADDYESMRAAPAPAPEQPFISPLAAQTTYPMKITATLQGITFDSNYDNGSLAAVVENGTNTFNCTTYTEPGELGSKNYWFRFRLTGVAGRTITLNISHSNNPRPFVRMGFTGPWRRMTSAEAPSTSRVVLAFDAATNTAEVAFYDPLGYAETLERVNDLVRQCEDATSEVLGQSYMGRDLWFVTVTDPTVPDSQKHRMWVHSRAHAGEHTSTHVMLGILAQATEDSPMGRHLRRHCIFNFVPLQNVDGVWLGHTRWDSQGIDPERQWCNPTRIPETALFQTRVDALMATSSPIQVALNLHSTVGNFADSFFYKHTGSTVTSAFEAIEQRYIDAVNNATPYFDNRDPQTSSLALVANCSTSGYAFIESYFWHKWGANVMAMTHEGHFYYRTTDGAWNTGADYQEVGRGMAIALIEYFGLDQPPQEGPNWILY